MRASAMGWECFGECARDIGHFPAFAGLDYAGYIKGQFYIVYWRACVYESCTAVRGRAAQCKYQCARLGLVKG